MICFFFLVSSSSSSLLPSSFTFVFLCYLHTKKEIGTHILRKLEKRSVTRIRLENYWMSTIFISLVRWWGSRFFTNSSVCTTGTDWVYVCVRVLLRLDCCHNTVHCTPASIDVAAIAAAHGPYQIPNRYIIYSWLKKYQENWENNAAVNSNRKCKIIISNQQHEKKSIEEKSQHTLCDRMW